METQIRFKQWMIDLKSYSELKVEFESSYNNIIRLRNLFSKKKFLIGSKFQFNEFPSFYHWYKNQGETCYYCNLDFIRRVYKVL